MNYNDISIKMTKNAFSQNEIWKCHLQNIDYFVHNLLIGFIIDSLRIEHLRKNIQ